MGLTNKGKQLRLLTLYTKLLHNNFLIVLNSLISILMARKIKIFQLIIMELIIIIFIKVSG